MKKVLLGILVLVVLLAGVVLVRTITFTSNQREVSALPVQAIPDSALQHFTAALRFQTISYADSLKLDSGQFLGLRRFLEKTYPHIHAKATRQIFKKYSLLYTINGTNTALKPYILMAHQDVVPIEGATRNKWTFDPFGGTVKDGFIWGRGTTDDKINLIGMFESLEKLLASGFQPTRTIYFAFGHDEEVGGKGAIAIADWFKKQGIEAELVLDEGGIVTREKVPGITKPVALIGNSEKGYLSLELIVEINGGHSSMPEAETAIDVLNKALVKLREKPFPARFSEPVQGFIQSLGPEMPFVEKMAFGNPWLFEGVIISTYEKSGPGNAMIRTTLVPTIMQAGIKDNVVPTQAKAVINLRLLPGDQTDEVINRLKDIIADERVIFRKLDPIAEASPVSSTTGVGYLAVETSIKQSLPETLSAPFLVIGATDSRHFTGISNQIIKFSPMIDPIGFHGIDERVSIESFKTAIGFYENLIRNSANP